MFHFLELAFCSSDFKSSEPLTVPSSSLGIGYILLKSNLLCLDETNLTNAFTFFSSPLIVTLFAHQLGIIFPPFS